MKNQDAKNYIINEIKKNDLFSSMKPICINVTEDNVNIAMVHKKHGGVEYVLEFSLRGWVTKYDCFDHHTTSYELMYLENIARKLKDAE